MYRTDDPIRDAEMHDAEEQRKLEKYPKCGYCEKRITEEYAYVINGKCFCEECLVDYHRISIADYIDEED